MSLMGSFCGQVPKQNRRRGCPGKAPFGETGNFSPQIKEERGQPAGRGGGQDDCGFLLCFLRS